MRRRKAIATVVGSTYASIAGCSGRSNGGDPGTTETIEIDSTEDAISKSDFDAHVTELRERYGDDGVWGYAEDEPDNDHEYVGAWTTSRPGDAEGVESEHVLALYRMNLRYEGADFYQFWLWNGVQGGDEDDAPSQIEAGVSFPEASHEMGTYGPATQYSASERDRYDVSISKPTLRAIGAEFSLAAGEAGIKPGQEYTSIGDAGTVQWYRTDGYTLAGTCEALWAEEDGYLFDWTVHVQR